MDWNLKIFFQSNKFNLSITTFKFIQTYHNYESIMQAYLMRPSKPNRQLTDLVMFVAHVAHCFPDELRTFPQQIIDILKRYATVLNPDVRLVGLSFLLLLFLFFILFNLFLDSMQMSNAHSKQKSNRASATLRGLFLAH